jgi:hypothetical protein
MASYLGRRKFLATLGGAAAAWPLAADDPEAQLRNAAFLRGLSELGWVVGRPEPTGHDLPHSKCEAYKRVYEQSYGSS